MEKINKGSEFSEERQTRVLLEDLHGQFRVFGEGMINLQKDMTDVRTRLDCIEIKVDHLDIQMSFVMKVLPTVATKDDLRQLDKKFDKRLCALEAAR